MLYILKSLDLEVCNNKIPLFCGHLLKTKKQTFYFQGNMRQRESNRHRTAKKRIFCRQSLELLNDTQAYYLCTQCSKAPDFIRKKKLSWKNGGSSLQISAGNGLGKAEVWIKRG